MGASENYVKIETLEKLKMNDVVLEERDCGWMIVEMVNDKIKEGIERQHQVHVKLKPGDDGYA
jgi:hypothetical protein